MKFCPNCGTPLTPGAKFCTECGQKLAVSTPAVPVKPAAPQPAVPMKPVQPVSAPAKDTYVPPKPFVQPQTFTQPQDGYTPPKPIAQPQTFQQPQDGYTPPKPIVQPQTFQQPQDGYTPPKPIVQPQSFPQPQDGHTPPQPPVPPQNYDQPWGEYAPYYGGAAQQPAKAPKQKKEPKKSGALKWILLGGGCLLVVALILVLVLSLAGGGDKDDPNLGLYHAVSCEYMGMELGAEGEWIELKPGGRATIYLEGDEYSCRWTKEADGFYLQQGGDTFAGTLIDGTLTLHIADLIYTYQKEAIAEPESSVPASTDVPAPNETTLEAEASTEAPAAGGTALGEAAVWENCIVQFVGAEPIKDTNDQDGIRVYFDFTNTSDETTYAMADLDSVLLQDGNSLAQTYVDYEEDVDEYGNDSRFVRPGTTIRCIMEYCMDPSGGDIQVTLYDIWNDAQSVSVTLDPQNLPGDPGELAFAPVTDPAWVAGLSDRGTLDGVYDVYIDTAEVIEGSEGEQLLRVYYEYTNNSDSPCSFWWASNVVVFQDGVELLYGYPVESVASDNNYYVDVDPGQQIAVSVCYVMLSNNPVEIEICDTNWVSGVGAIFEMN